MTLGAPYWLWALAALPVLAYLFVANERRRKSLLEKIVALRLQATLAGSISPLKRRLRFAIQLLGLAAVIVSLARPQIGYTWEENKHKGRDILIAIDTSKSMLSTDVSPNRLTRAKLAAQDLVSQLQGDRVGVLAFAGSAFLQAPLTVDYIAVNDSINDLDTSTIPVGGTNIASVINEAAKAFGKGESENRCLILFTDGEELEDDAVSAARNQAGNFRIFTVGVGTREGSLIPITNADGGTDFVKDPEGQIVKSKLDEPRLKEIAEATGGFYTHLENGLADMKKILEEVLGSVKARDIDSRMSRHPIERYQWPLGLGLLLLAASVLMSEKRRTPVPMKNGSGRVARATVATLAVIWIGMASAHAAGLSNEGIDLYNNKKYEQSYDAFNSQLQKNPDSQALEFDSGAAAYKQGDYDKAIDAFAKAIASPRLDVQGKSEYNLANALCMRGLQQKSKKSKRKDWNNALQHYDEALKADPNNGDAKYNRDVVKKLIEDLEKKPPQSQQNQQQNKDQDEDDDKQDQKNQQNQQNQNNQQNQKDQKQNQDQQQQQQQSQGNDQQQKQQQQQQNNRGSNGQNNENSQSQKNQSQQGSQQDQKKDSSSKSDQNQQSQNGQDQQQQQQQSQSQGNDQQQKQSGSSGQNQNQNQDQGQNQQQQGQQNPSPDNENGSRQNSSQGSQQPTPAFGEPDKKFSGKILAQDQSAESQAAEREPVYVPGQQREMTPSEAARIVESVKDEEAKDVLNEHKSSAPVLKDW